MLLSLELRAIVAISILAVALVLLVVAVVILIGRSRARAKKRLEDQCRVYSEQKAVAQQVASESHAAATAEQSTPTVETQETTATEEEISAADEEPVAGEEVATTEQEPTRQEETPTVEEEPAAEEDAVEESAAKEVAATEQEPATEQDTATTEQTPAAEEIAEEEPTFVAATQTPVVTQPTNAPVVKTAAIETAAADARPAFIDKLTKNFTPELTTSFERIVLENAASVKTRVKPVSQYDSEEAFLADFFRSSSKYVKILPIAVTEELYRRNRKNLKSDKDKVRARRKMMNAYYARRKEEDTLKKCETLCKEDVTYHLDTLGVTGVALPPLKRLIMLSVSKKRFADAIRWCDVAIAHNLIDTKGQGYENRKQKLIERKARVQAAERKRKAKEAAKKGNNK